MSMNVLVTVMPHHGGRGGESEVSSFSSEVLTPATAVWGLCRHSAVSSPLSALDIITAQSSAAQTGGW